MKKIKIVSFLLTLIVLVVSLNSVSALSVGNADGDSVYTLSEAKYDIETEKLAYQKISYSKNTYKTTTVTDVDATGAPVDVSSDAQYIFLPYEHLNHTENTTLSIKYKNYGVSSIAVHIEYGPGISQGGVDYDAGYRYVCVNAFDAWNVTKSKSVDGYDVVSILYGSYATDIYDINLRGFRLYFDYGYEVNQLKEFEIFGYEVHEDNITPSFASDPKDTRITKFSSKDVVINNNQFSVLDTANLEAKILDYKTGNDQIAFTFNVDSGCEIQYKLDGEVVLTEEYGYGKHTAYIPLTKEEYSTFELLITGSNVNFKIISTEFYNKPYVDEFSGSGFEIIKTDSNTTVKYNYAVGWYALSGTIRRYNPEYDFLKININISHPIVIGMLIDDQYIRSHYTYSEPLAAGDYEFLFDVSNLNITSSSNLVIYLDPAITGYQGIDAMKTVIFSNIEFIRSKDLPKAEITVTELFEFTYDGKGKAASGARTNSGSSIYYEYKLVGDDEKNYTTDLPIDAGTYDVRVVSEQNQNYGKTYAYSKLVINKAQTSAPSRSVLNVDYAKNKVYFDESLFLVSSDEDFQNIINSGSYVTYGMKLYVKYFESLNYFESSASCLELNKREDKIEDGLFEIDFARETTTTAIPNNIEYSIDGLNWIQCNNKKVSLEPGHIYLFRNIATETSFASEITYLAVPQRPQINEEIEVLSTTDTSITLKAVSNAQYKLSDTVWQDSTEFGYLEKGMQITIYMRIKGNETTFASDIVTLEYIVGIGVFVPPVETTPDITTPEETTPDITTPEEIDTPNESHKKKNKGCGGSIGASVLGMSILLVAVVYLKKKEKEV